MSLELVPVLPQIDFLNHYKANVLATVGTLDTEKISQVADILKVARNENRKIFLCGNGGSASTASHFICDIVKGASFGREARFRAIALTDSLPTLTAYANDLNYESVFVEQLRNFAEPGDVLICISGSGNSPNTLRAIEYANSIHCQTIAFTGRDGGRLGAMAKLEIRAASNHMGEIEDAHMIICHMIAYLLMEGRDSE